VLPGVVKPTSTGILTDAIHSAITIDTE